MIDEPYLLVMTLPCFIGADGQRRVHELWHKDLVAHLVEIRHLTLIAPLEYREPTEPTLPLDLRGYPGELTFVDLPPCSSLTRTIKALPTITARLWRAVGRARIVHANAGGWPISFGWLAIPMAKVRRKFTITVVESGSWRLGFKPPYRARDFVEACLFEGMGRVLVNVADVAAFTHKGYLDSMLSRWRRSHGHIVSASWIDHANILAPDHAAALGRDKTTADRPLRVVFAATLKVPKGVMVLLEAAHILTERGVPIQLDIYGEGGLKPDCAQAAASLQGSVSVRLCDPVAYGEPFFAMLETHDVMVVPSLSDEQPRVIYDCFARALPVIASQTAGNAECVHRRRQRSPHPDRRRHRAGRRDRVGHAPPRDTSRDGDQGARSRQRPDPRPDARPPRRHHRRRAAQPGNLLISPSLSRPPRSLSPRPAELTESESRTAGRP